MKRLGNRKTTWFVFLLVMTLICCNMNAYADELDDDEVDTGERVEYVEGDTVEQIDQYVDGLYNSNENARAMLSGMIRLAQSGTKLYGSYSSSYTYVAERIGVKNVKLQYKGSLGLWHTIITIDNRYFSNSATYTGSFTTTGVIGRVYRLKGTHYATYNGSTETRNNVTENLTFN